jgi:hypothetical protein
LLSLCFFGYLLVSSFVSFLLSFWPQFRLVFRLWFSSEEQRQLTDEGLTELRASAAAKFAENGAALDALSAASAENLTSATIQLKEVSL